MVEVKPAWTFVRERRYLALRTGVATAVASVGPSFARGLLPRSTTDQAMVTGATAAYALGFSALGLSIAEAVSEIIVNNRQGGNPENIALAASAIVAAAGGRRHRRRPGRQQRLPAAGDRPVAWRAWSPPGRVAGALVVGSDRILRPCRRRPRTARQPRDRRGAGRRDRGVTVALRNRRARRHGRGTPGRAQGRGRRAQPEAAGPLGGHGRGGRRRAGRPGGRPVRDRRGNPDPGVEAPGAPGQPGDPARRARRGRHAPGRDRGRGAQPRPLARDARRRRRRAGLPRRAHEPARDGRARTASWRSTRSARRAGASS